MPREPRTKRDEPCEQQQQDHGRRFGLPNTLREALEAVKAGEGNPNGPIATAYLTDLQVGQTAAHLRAILNLEGNEALEAPAAALPILL